MENGEMLWQPGHPRSGACQTVGQRGTGATFLPTAAAWGCNQGQGDLRQGDTSPQMDQGVGIGSAERDLNSTQNLPRAAPPAASSP